MRPFGHPPLPQQATGQGGREQAFQLVVTDIRCHVVAEHQVAAAAAAGPQVGWDQPQRLLLQRAPCLGCRGTWWGPHHHLALIIAVLARTKHEMIVVGGVHVQQLQIRADTRHLAQLQPQTAPRTKIADHRHEEREQVQDQQQRQPIAQLGGGELKLASFSRIVGG
ncbi:MAG: hypothetical protein GTO03_16315 [Planctomycetales bacterium]|nr:hypothetical protein [Planctomycetales bacterium]